jgi:hypothetical protein
VPAAVPVIAVIALVAKEITTSSGPVLARRLVTVGTRYGEKLTIPPKMVRPDKANGVVVTTPVNGSVTEMLAVIVPPVMAEGAEVW